MRFYLSLEKKNEEKKSIICNLKLADYVMEGIWVITVQVKYPVPTVVQVTPQKPNEDVFTKEEKAIKALYETTALLQLHPGSSVNSPDYLKYMEGEVKRLAHNSYERNGKTVDVKAIRESTKYKEKELKKPTYSSGYRYGMVYRMRQKRPSYYDGNNGNETYKRNKRSGQDWTEVNYGKRGLRRPKPDEVFDCFDEFPTLSSKNRFDVLLNKNVDKDLRLSSDDSD